MKKDLIIKKQKEIIKNFKEVGVFYFERRNRATKDDVDKMKTLHDKGISLESELAALESEQEERKTAEEIYLSKVKNFDVKTAQTFIYKNDAIEAMHEFASQSLPVISDEEIEKTSKEFHKIHGGYHPDFAKGARWYKITQKVRLWP